MAAEVLLHALRAAAPSRERTIAFLASSTNNMVSQRAGPPTTQRIEVARCRIACCQQKERDHRCDGLHHTEEQVRAHEEARRQEPIRDLSVVATITASRPFGYGTRRVSHSRGGRLFLSDVPQGSDGVHLPRRYAVELLRQRGCPKRQAKQTAGSRRDLQRALSAPIVLLDV